jgi:hypothetical protein
MNITIENYNKLVPLMNELEDNGIEVDEFHSNNEGFGFYAEAENGHYVDVHVWGDEIAVSLSRHNSGFRHDVVNDILLTPTPVPTVKTVEEVKKLVYESLDLAKTLCKHYQVDLLETELKAIINLVDGNLKEKLNSYLQTK